MAMTYTEFKEKSKAEVVGGRLIVGERHERRFVGSIEGGVFTLNEEGMALQEALEAGAAPEDVKPKPKRQPKLQPNDE